MQAVLGWGPISKDLDLNSVEYNKDTKANCRTYYGKANCTGSRWLIDNTGVNSFNNGLEFKFKEIVHPLRNEERKELERLISMSQLLKNPIKILNLHHNFL